MPYLVNYIDPVKATVAVLRDWRERLWKIEHTPEMIEEIDTQLTNSTSRLNATPVSGGGGNKTEAALVNGISRKEIALYGFEQAQGAEKELAVAWRSLTEDEKFLLWNRFVDNDDRKGIHRIMNRMHVEKSQAYAMCDEALHKLSARLFWRTH